MKKKVVLFLVFIFVGTAAYLWWKKSENKENPIQTRTIEIDSIKTPISVIELEDSIDYNVNNTQLIDTLDNKIINPSIKKEENSLFENMGFLISDQYEISFEQKINEPNKILINGVDAGVLEKGEQPVQLTEYSIYTIQKKGDCAYGAGTFTIREKTINGTNLINKKESVFPCTGRTVHFFKDGSFVFRESGEEGGNQFHFCNSNLDSSSEYTPDEMGFSQSFLDIYKNKILIATKSNNPDKGFSISYLDNIGDAIFSHQLPKSVTSISQISASEKYLAVNGYSVNPTIHKIFVFDTLGRLLIERDIKSAVKKMGFINVKKPQIILGYQNSLELLDISSGQILDEILYQDIYKEAGLTSNRPDKYTDIIDIVSSEKSTGILLSEPTSIGQMRKNNILYILRENFDINVRIIDLGDSNHKPSMTVYDSQIIVLLNNEILRYE